MIEPFLPTYLVDFDVLNGIPLTAAAIPSLGD